MIVFDIPKVILQFREKVKIFIFSILTLDDVYGLYMYALETWYLLLAQEEGLLLVEEDLLLLEEEDLLLVEEEDLLVGEEYMDMEDVFLLDKIIWIYKMSFYHILYHLCCFCFFVFPFHFFDFYHG